MPKIIPTTANGGSQNHKIKIKKPPTKMKSSITNPTIIKIALKNIPIKREKRLKIAASKNSLKENPRLRPTTILFQGRK